MAKTLKVGKLSAKEDKKLVKRNLDIYIQRMVEKQSIPELQKEYGLSRSQIFNCLALVDKEIGGSIPEKIKLQGAIFNLEERTKDLLKVRREELAKGKQRSIRNLAELEVQIRNNQELELKLSGLLKQVISIESSEEVGIKDILKTLYTLDKAGVPDEKRVEMTTKILTSKVV